MSLSLQEIFALAPDDSSISAAQALTSQHKWQNLSFNSQLGSSSNSKVVWGQCQGSGKTPYQTVVDVTLLAYKCSCPSRKFPCKHSLALLILEMEEPEIFTSQEFPTFVQDWLQRRQAKEASKGEKVEKEEEKANTSKNNSKTGSKTKSKGESKSQKLRLSKMQLGAQELHLWLQDILTQGLVSAQNQPTKYWVELSKRMVDAQMPGIAAVFQKISQLPSGENWPQEVLAYLSQIYLATKSLQSEESWSKLPLTRQQDIFTFLGVNLKREEVLANSQQRLNDTWQVLGKQIVASTPKLKEQKIWLQGEVSKQEALLLDYAYGGINFENNFSLGEKLEAEIVYYPGNSLRALIAAKTEKSQQTAITDKDLDKSDKSNKGEEKENLTFDPKPNSSFVFQPKWANFTQFTQEYGQKYSQNPFLQIYPLFVGSLRLEQIEEKWVFVDREDNFLPLDPKFKSFWEILAITGGENFDLFGEWDGQYICPLSLKFENKLFTF